MTIIHRVKAFPRLASAALAERMRMMPSIAVTSGRQTRESTLAEQRMMACQLNGLTASSSVFAVNIRSATASSCASCALRTRA